MRQAGRILPEYRAVRSGMRDFRELVETPEKACEVTLQPVDLLGVDAAIIFSDILVIPDAMGLPYAMVPGTGPVFEQTIKSAKDVDALAIPDPETELKYVLDAIRMTKKELNNRVPLIGFAGAPWTIFSYMIEGGGSKTFSKARKFLVTEPVLAHQLLSKITESTINYLNAQIDAGADMVQVFDSWAGVLSPSLYAEFGTPYLKRICDEVTRVPKTLFAKGAYFALKDLASLNCNTIGLDWQMDVQNARELTPGKTLQGNLDPVVLYGDEASIVRQTEAMLQRFGVRRHIANLGHGVYPDTEPEKVKVFIETIKEYKHTEL